MLAFNLHGSCFVFGFLPVEADLNGIAMSFPPSSNLLLVEQAPAELKYFRQPYMLDLKQTLWSMIIFLNQILRTR